MNGVKRIQIVDDKDEIIGFKERNAIDYKKDIYRVSAIWITNSKGEVLIAQRKFDKDKDPGKWGPAAAGTLDEGETYEDNIYKEAEEELGIKNMKFSIGLKERVRSPRNFFCQWFTLEMDWELNQFMPQKEEVERILWIDKSELVRDVKENPEKYIPYMPDTVKLFI
jgi:isopentenyldiphosphate isomerase